MINKLRTALAIALVAAAGPVAALGLGQIQVKSRLDQPLLAEIPIISGNPAELEQLQARLASPDTFRRVGLEPPSGIAADLQFSVALDERGRPVIRVTSAVPVNQPLVSFLVEVDWGQGRLVREYSALLDTPRTVAAPAQPPIVAPVVAPSNTVVVPVVAAPPAPAPPAPAASPPAEPQPESSGEVAITPEPAPAAAPEPTPTTTAIATPPEAPSELRPVQPGQTLSQIAGGLDLGRDYTLDQTMLALLRANPEAFIGDNVNLLKQGAVLRVPRSGEVSHYSAAEAAAVVRDQMDQWREARRPAPQPAAVASMAAENAPQAAVGSGARVAGARLEIVPPASGGNRPGTRSGASAGGEGDMLRQELQQTKEDLAARNAEVEELKARVADLEKLQQQQQQLISMKDSELAGAQQRLAEARKAAPGEVAATPAQATASDKPAPAANGAWMWGGVALVVLGLLAWLAARRRRVRPEPVRRGYDTAALAAGIPTAVAVDAVDDEGEDEEEDQGGIPAAPVHDEPAPAAHWTAAPAAIGAAPTWHAGSGRSTTAVDTAAPADASQQLELARAYLDLGDDDAARSLLREVLAGRDPAARETAARLLRDL